LDLSIDIEIGQNTQELLSILVADAQSNVTDVVLFEAGTPGNVNLNAIADLENALLNGQTFAMDIEIIGRDVLLREEEVNFQLVFKFDVTTRIKLD